MYLILAVQVDPSKRACLDNETGLLVNHAYGLAAMKVMPEQK